MSHDVFISYSTKDSSVATVVCAGLEDAGVRCWMAPRDVEAGAAYDESIIDAIEGSRAMILIFSRNSNASEGVLNEIRNARGLKPPLTVIPLRIEDVPLSKALRFHLTAAQWIDVAGSDVDGPVKELAARLRRTGVASAAAAPLQNSATTTAPASADVSPTHDAAAIVVAASAAPAEKPGVPVPPPAVSSSPALITTSMISVVVDPPRENLAAMKPPPVADSAASEIALARGGATNDLGLHRRSGAQPAKQPVLALVVGMILTLGVIALVFWLTLSPR